jgi:hypothetical protein
MNILAWALIASMTLLFATGLLAALEQARFFRWVRDHHIRLWLTLGGPSFSTTNWPAPKEAHEFLAQQKYLEVPDPELHLLGMRARRMWRAFAWQFVPLLLLALALTIAGQLRR